MAWFRIATSPPPLPPPAGGGGLGGGHAASDDLSLAKLLAAVASILRDSTGRFEETSDRIAQLVVSPEKAGAGVDIIVALQEFDRLRQDFNAIETILAGCSRVVARPTVE